MSVRTRLTNAQHAHRLRQYRSLGSRLGANVHIAAGTKLTANTVIDDNVWINGAAALRGHGTIKIGSWTAIGHQLIIATVNHDTGYPNMVLNLHWKLGLLDLENGADVTIGPGSWLGDRVTILGGAHLGAGCVVAAGSVVPRGGYPAYSIIGGNPAKVIRRRAADDVVDALVASEWWTWDMDEMGSRKTFFETPITHASALEVLAAVAG